MASSPKRPADAKGETSNAKRAKKNGETSKGETGKKAPSAEVKLQQSLLQSDKELARLFLQAMREKPDGVSQKQLVRQFWASRDHLLRAHAAELEQRCANYNVFSEVKPRNVEGAIKLNITPEQVEDIFRQHPVVRTAYNDTVPNKYPDNMHFWSEFFVSRLFKKLKGERITEGDQQNPTLDKYTNSEPESRLGQEVAQHHVPHFIDLEGNEQNHSQRKGNQPDRTMRPDGPEKVPILRILNSMSEKIMAHVSPADGGRHAPVGIDEETYNQLRLHDLQGDDGEDQIRLKIRDQQRLHTGHDSTDAPIRPTQVQIDPQHALAVVRKGLFTASSRDDGMNSMELSGLIGFPEDSEDESESEEDDEGNKGQQANSGRKSAFEVSLRHANSHIQSLVTQQTDTFTNMSDPSTRGDIEVVAKTLDMPPTKLQELLLTHQTTNEFLHYFWHLLLTSRSASDELPSLLGTLEKSLLRMANAAKAQEDVRAERLLQLKRKAQEDQARLRHRMAVNETEAGPGRREVERLLEPMVRAIGVAKDRFEKTMTSSGAGAAITA